MHIYQVMSAVYDNIGLYLGCLIVSAVLAGLLNSIVLRRYVGGLLSLQVSFVFNTGIILFGLARGAVSISRTSHFAFYEVGAVCGVYLIYSGIIARRRLLFEALGSLSYMSAIGATVIVFNVLLTIMFLQFVPTDGSSRIEFMTASWFSFCRPFVSILSPLGFILPIYLLDRKRRLLPTLILASSVVSNIASGSRASFAFGFLDAILLYRDLKGSTLSVTRWAKYALFGGIALATKLTLDRLSVGAEEIIDRFIKFGDATIMVYYSDDPSAVAAGVSMFAKIHRGVAKLFGDSSAADVETLFGFALNKLEYGGHAFTGPNAQIPSYMFCNYAGWENLVAIGSIGVYLGATAWFCKNVVFSKQEKAGVLLFPFIVFSLNSFPQDYNQGASDLTVMAGVVIVLACIALLRGAKWRKPQFQY